MRSRCSIPFSAARDRTTARKEILRTCVLRSSQFLRLTALASRSDCAAQSSGPTIGAKECLSAIRFFAKVLAALVRGSLACWTEIKKLGGSNGGICPDWWQTPDRQNQT